MMIKMHKSAIAVLAICLTIIIVAEAKIFDLERIQNYTRLLGFSQNLSDNELWHGIIQDCSKKVTFSCIQKNAYAYLDDRLLNSNNVTVFEGLSLVKNNLDYDACSKDDPKSNLVEDDVVVSEEGRNLKDDETKKRSGKEETNMEEEEYENLSPLEEVTHALREKAMRFLATKDYKFQLPGFIGSGAGIKISPREIDERGALVRIDFDTQAMEEQQQGRLFFIKKIKKQIQNKILTAILLIILLIKILKLKFFVVIPYLFGIATAKKLFLKLLLFLIPAFGKVFKLCSSYYSMHGAKYHHHHHKIAHHHHHIPVYVPKPVYFDNPSPSVTFDHPPPPPPHHSSGPPPPYILDEDFQGYEYGPPHMQYRKDIEELKEWGIEPYEEDEEEVLAYDRVGTQPIYPVFPSNALPKLNPKISHVAPFPAKPSLIVDKLPPLPSPHATHSLAYSAYAPSRPGGSAVRQQPLSAASLPIGVVAAPPVTSTKQMNKQPIFVGFSPPQQQSRPRNPQQIQQMVSPAPAAPLPMPPSTTTIKPYDDEFYGPIIERLDNIFNQLRFSDENCRERLVCSMYKKPGLYAPHSNLVSNELSRDLQELQQKNLGSPSSQRFYRYLNAARLGQDGGDCLQSFYCSINTE